MRHKYHITVEELVPEGAETSPALKFEVENHDDILSIVSRLERRADFSVEEARAFGVGLKLFSEVMLSKKSEPLFADFLPHFVEFMKKLKKG